MGEFRVGKAITNAFRNIYSNKLPLLIILLLNTAATIGVTFFFAGAIISTVLTGILSIMLGAPSYDTFGISTIMVIAIVVAVAIYQAVLAVVYVKLAANKSLDEEMSYDELIKFSVSRFGHSILATIILVAVAIPILLLSSLLASALGIVGVILFIIAVLTLMVHFSFILQGIVVDELSATAALNNSFEFVKTCFWKVVGLLILLGIMSFIFDRMFLIVGKSFGIVGGIIVLTYQFLKLVYFYATLTEFYCQSKKTMNGDYELEYMKKIDDSEEQFEVQ